jgi:hypothetical protein
MALLPRSTATIVAAGASVWSTDRGDDLLGFLRDFSMIFGNIIIIIF